MTPRFRFVFVLLAQLLVLGGCAGETTSSQSEPDDAGVAPRPDAGKTSAPKAAADAGTTAETECPTVPTHIEADLEFSDARGTIHISVEAEESFGSSGSILMAFAPEAAIDFPFGLRLRFFGENIVKNKAYPLSLADQFSVGVMFEDSVKDGIKLSIAAQGTMTFSHVRTSECEATVGTFENALGISNGPNHPFSVRVKGTFRTGT